MRFNLFTKNILVALAAALAASETIKTPSGKVVPKELMEYLNCPIGNESCKQNKFAECKNEVNRLREEKYKYEIDSKKFNKIDKEESLYSEICEMVNSYNKPLQESDVYDIKDYFACEKEENKRFSKEDCTELSRACDKISRNETLRRDERIHSTMTIWLECPIGDEECRKESTKKCKESAKNCKKIYKKNERYVDIPSESEYCENYRAVCDMVMDYKPALSYDNLFNLDGYLSCKKTDVKCITKKEEICKEVLDICKSDNYPKTFCNDIKTTCDKVKSMKKNATKTTSTTKTKTTKTKTTKSKTTCACAKGYCCSKWGYCGKDSAYCGKGCQSKFGICN
ncbi:carbohydrate-binding module family 18 protein [Piromyces sp. E2]|nr:carbohydrate-binding module family 18 protein [Piromyces sp. E2]|eukprot:OUM59157.1 carbohydrate-binding module family 18 protein [Piromyces sp. E2]